MTNNKPIKTKYKCDERDDDYPHTHITPLNNIVESMEKGIEQVFTAYTVKLYNYVHGFITKDELLTYLREECGMKKMIAKRVVRGCNNPVFQKVLNTMVEKG